LLAADPAPPSARRPDGKAEALAHLGVAEKEDLAAAVVFLASRHASRITGQALSITGGISALDLTFAAVKVRGLPLLGRKQP
jgi:NAD(P)-dependent dehydrogenase (short-subunit alcohol dehydrogenase family)